MSLKLLDLNDDVLCRIANELHGANALRFSLASKRSHAFAIHRVPAVVRFGPDDHNKLGFHRHYLLNGPKPRARHIEELVFALDVVRHRELVDPQAPQSEHLKFVVDLITNAPNLRRLTLPETSRLIERHPRLKESLLRLRRLTRVELDGVGLGPALDSLRSTAWNLKVLSLGYEEEFPDIDYNVAQHPRPWAPLLTALAAFPHLHTLRILSFHTATLIEDIGNATSPVFPSIRELFIGSSSSTALDLAYLMPNLQTLDYGMMHVAGGVPVRMSPKLPALRSLMFSSSESLSCIEERLGIAHHFRIAFPVRCHEPDTNPQQAEQVKLITTAFQKVSPVRAEIALTVGGRPMEFWMQVAVNAPRLRYLELRVHLAGVYAACEGWLDNIPGALASLPLVGLRLHLSEMPGIDPRMINEAPWHPDNPVYRPLMALAKKLYSARLESLKTLPRQLANAIHSLKVVAIADAQLNRNYDGTPRFIRPRESWKGGQLRLEVSLPVGHPSVDGPRDNWDEYANQNFWYIEPVMALEWWRIVREEDEVVRLDALTVSQGRQVQQFFENSDFETLDRTIDGFISGL